MLARQRLCRLLILLLLLALAPGPAAAVLCEIYAPCDHAGAGRVVFVGTVRKVTEEQRADWPQPELIAYLRVDERLSKPGPKRSKLALLSSGFYAVGKRYLIVATPWRDGVFVEWRGDGYRGFQTSLVCGPSIRLDRPASQEYLDHFRKAFKRRVPVAHSVYLYDESGEDSQELSGALVHLSGKAGSYWSTADSDGAARFESIHPGIYRWEVWDGDQRFKPDEETSPTIEVVPGSCSHSYLGLLLKP